MIICWHIDIQRMASAHGKTNKPHIRLVTIIESRLLILVDTHSKIWTQRGRLSRPEPEPEPRVVRQGKLG